MTPLQLAVTSLVATSLLLVAASARARAQLPSAKATLELRGAHILVEDVPKTVTFYERAFGLSVKYMHPTQGYAELASGAMLLAFISEKFIQTSNLLGTLRFHENRRDREASGSQLVFISTDITEDYARAVRAGAVVVSSPSQLACGTELSRFARQLETSSRPRALPELAKLLGTSERTLRRRMLAEGGLTPKRYLRALRMRRALSLLARAIRNAVSQSLSNAAPQQQQQQFNNVH